MKILGCLHVIGLVSLLGAPYRAHAFDDAPIRAKIQAARPGVPATSSLVAASIVPGTEMNDRQSRLKSEQDAAYELMKTCEGRFGALQGTLRRQVSRAEWISGIGGFVGVLGAVATCPHCSALAAGIAGLANPLQQTFKDNVDSPQDTREFLQKLSVKIDEELKRYAALPPADINDSGTFEVNLRNRLDALLLTSASCAFYQSRVQQSQVTKESTTKP